VPFIVLNKPFRVLSQFREADNRATLSRFVAEPAVYPAGRLDFDSEGLVLLTDDGALQARISEPGGKLWKIYLAQVEGTPSRAQLEQLMAGTILKDGLASALRAELVEEPGYLWPRSPPIRYRANIPASWIRLSIDEGRNRQVRRMTAAVGLPTLRLIRCAVGPWSVAELQPGQRVSISNDRAWRELRSWRQPAA
jgi:23S rRNA pseudouridine2457 synthase